MCPLPSIEAHRLAKQMSASGYHLIILLLQSQDLSTVYRSSISSQSTVSLNCIWTVSDLSSPTEHCATPLPPSSCQQRGNTKSPNFQMDFQCTLPSLTRCSIRLGKNPHSSQHPCHRHHRSYFFYKGDTPYSILTWQDWNFFLKLPFISDVSQPFNGCPWKCHILNPCLFVTICLYFSIFVCLSVFLDPRLFILLCNTISGHSMCSSIRRILGILAGAQCNTWTVDKLGFSLQWFYNLWLLTSCFLLQVCRTSLF